MSIDEKKKKNKHEKHIPEDSLLVVFLGLWGWHPFVDRSQSLV